MVLRGRSQLVESFIWLVPPVRIVRLIALSLSLVVHGRSSFVESLVWLFPFLCAICKKKKRRRRRRIRKREHVRGEAKDETRDDEREKRKDIREKGEKNFKKKSQNKKISQTNCHIMIRKKKKKTLDGIIRHFFIESSEPHNVSNELVDSNSIFGLAGINLESIFARMV